MRFSIVMPVYNMEKYLKTSLDCIVGQTFGDYEVIIVNDGLTDNSQKIMSEYAEKLNLFVNNKEFRKRMGQNSQSAIRKFGLEVVLG